MPSYTIAKYYSYVLDVKIKQRHALLVRTIGTKAEEETSYTHSHNLVMIVTASMIALCILEVASYYLYNRKVSLNSADSARVCCTHLKK